ncbi:hypothetical protein BDR22DRAFT_855395 [Usnea florida]
MTLYALHPHQEMFGDTGVFRPKRSVVSESFSAASDTKAQSASFSFSLDSQACRSKRLAYKGMAIATVRLVFRSYGS